MLFQYSYGPLDLSRLQVVGLLGQPMADQESSGLKDAQEAYLEPLELVELSSSTLCLVTELLEVFAVGDPPHLSESGEEGHHLSLVIAA